MTFEKLCDLFEKCHIPSDVRLLSDSGWECGATDMDGVFYNEKKKAIVFTQGMSFENARPDQAYASDSDWELIYYVKSDPLPDWA